MIDLRHPDAGALAGMLEAALGAAGTAATERGCTFRSERVWGIEPIEFDARLVAAARESCRELTGVDREMTSGALHDAAEIAKVLPAAMVFSPSIAGISHAPNEDTADEDLAVAIEAYGRLANRALALDL
jgi:N-carbamoyl-L-amino-acid hydrolase